MIPRLNRVFLVKEAPKKYSKLDLQAMVYPTEHFDPDEVPDGDDFVELSGDPRFANSSIFRDDDGPNSVMYHPKHWKPIEEFPEGQLDRYWYRTDTGGKVALQALTPNAKKFLQMPSARSSNEEDLVPKDQRGRHQGGEN